jgi:hypothetical protein
VKERSFPKARDYVRKLGIRSNEEWRAWSRSTQRPNDILKTPGDKVYADAGWKNWRDWLGTGRQYSTKWRPFDEARIFAQKLGLNFRNEWMVYGRAGKKPNDIPANPRDAYTADWNGWGDWLGTGRRRGSGWRPFNEAQLSWDG